MNTDTGINMVTVAKALRKGKSTNPDDFKLSTKDVADFADIKFVQAILRYATAGLNIGLGSNMINYQEVEVFSIGSIYINRHELRVAVTLKPHRSTGNEEITANFIFYVNDVDYYTVIVPENNDLNGAPFIAIDVDRSVMDSWKLEIR